MSAARGGRRIGPNEATTRVAKVDRVGNRVEQAIEQIALVEQRILGCLQPGDVDERDHDACGAAFCAIRQDPQEHRASGLIADLSLEALATCQHAANVSGEVGVIHRVRKGLDRATDILWQEIQALGDPRGKLANPHPFVEENRFDLRTRD